MLFYIDNYKILFYIHRLLCILHTQLNHHSVHLTSFKIRVKKKYHTEYDMGGGEGQTYCLRWNNHKSNLVEILEGLFKHESYVDCTLRVDDGKFFVHRIILAANSAYFQTILQEVPMEHCTILFPGVKKFEMKPLLDYMYTGEVNITQAQIPRIMQIAVQLGVKGLYDMTEMQDKFDRSKMEDPSYPGIYT